MEKRVVLAFVLSMIVMVIWLFLFAPKTPKAPPQEEVTPPKEQKAFPESVETPFAKAPPLPKEEMKILPKAKEKEIEVETPLYRAVFTNVGPTVKSFKLKNYRETPESDSPLIDLRPRDRWGGHASIGSRLPRRRSMPRHCQDQDDGIQGRDETPADAV